jgi:glutamate N-acetyltransferase/amino-acid N-acetyltransferase
MSDINFSDELPQGFIGLTANVGLKNLDDDCLLVASTVQASSVSVFTKSLFAGPSVVLSRESLVNGPLQGVVVLSKNANVATGKKGYEHAQELQKLAADVLGLPQDKLLVASTGVIGKKYPMNDIRESFHDFSGKTGTLTAQNAAKAIMTTDTHPKVSKVKCGNATLVGIAKGVGMIEPNMATMLAFFFTDAALAQNQLNTIFRNVVNRTFNALSIDTDTSTSDTAAIFANGLAGSVNEDEFSDSLYQCALDLVKQIASDGEGATKTIIVNVKGARNNEQAKLVAKSIVNSPLVKTAIHGSDPNWGRVVMAIGKLDTETDIDPIKTVISFGHQQVYPLLNDIQQDHELKKLKDYLSGSEIEINIFLSIAEGEFTAYGCDLSEGYIRINADYTT